MGEIDKIKQVIVIRKDLRMRRGKEIAQGSHASMEFLRKRLERYYYPLEDRSEYRTSLTEVESRWWGYGMGKITCQVSSLDELLEIHKKAIESGLEAHIIEDEGLTEFHGVYTKTALAIGPDYSSKIDPITKGLKLY